jgi:hypothetical protein
LAVGDLVLLHLVIERKVRMRRRKKGGYCDGRCRCRCRRERKRKEEELGVDYGSFVALVVRSYG